MKLKISLSDQHPQCLLSTRRRAHPQKPCEQPQQILSIICMHAEKRNIDQRKKFKYTLTPRPKYTLTPKPGCRIATARFYCICQFDSDAEIAYRISASILCIFRIEAHIRPNRSSGIRSRRFRRSRQREVYRLRTCRGFCSPLRSGRRRPYRSRYSAGRSSFRFQRP